MNQLEHRTALRSCKSLSLDSLNLFRLNPAGTLPERNNFPLMAVFGESDLWPIFNSRIRRTVRNLHPPRQLEGQRIIDVFRRIRLTGTRENFSRHDGERELGFSQSGGVPLPSPRLTNGIES